MAHRIATSDPKPSSRPQSRGYYYFYFNKRTASGGECMALVPESIRDLVKKDAFMFDDRCLEWDESLQASVLKLDFDNPALEDSSLPPREEGWSDPDHPTALESADPHALTAVAQHQAAIPNRGLRPATVRKRDAAARAAEHNLPAGFLQRLEYLIRAQRLVSTAIGVQERPRAVDSQKLVVTAWIDYTKSCGTQLTEEEERDMKL